MHMYFITGLLRYHLHAIQFTYLVCTILWFLVYSWSCATITTVNYRTFSSQPKETLYSLVIMPHFTPVPHPPALGN